MAAKTFAQILGDFVHDLSFRDLPPQVVEKAEISIADGLACAIAGKDLPSAHIALGLWKEMNRGGRSTLWATGEKGDAEATAWANCILMHGILHDDMQESTIGHMGSLIIPVALAAAEEEGRGGQDLIPAVVAAYEVAGRIAVASGLKIVKRGFRASPVFGPFAAAAAAGKLLGLNREEMRNAISCAASFSCGLLEAVNSGSMEWRFQNGAALRNGIMAARLAQKGLYAAPTALEGKCGFLAAFGGPEAKEEVRARLEEITATLGRDYEVVKNIFKPYPTCGYNQVGVEVAVALARRHDIQPAEVESVRAYVSPENKNYPGGDFHGPFATLDQALLSKPFSLAAAILFRTITVDMYLAGLNQASLAELAGKVSSETKEGMGFLDYKIEIKLKNGKTVSGDQSLADAVNYSLNRDRAVEKFCRMTSSRWPGEKAHKITEAIFRLPEISNVTDFTSLLL